MEVINWFSLGGWYWVDARLIFVLVFGWSNARNVGHGRRSGSLVFENVENIDYFITSQ